MIPQVLNGARIFSRRTLTRIGRRLDSVSRGYVGVVRPTIFIIGAQKAGTTALAQYLAKHRKVVCPTTKEIDFFGSDVRYSLGLDFYLGHFPAKYSSNLLSFDASPHYLLHPNAAERIYEYNCECKIICLVRNPTERAYSAWQMYRRKLINDPQFMIAWNKRIFQSERRLAFQKRPASDLDDFNKAVSREIEYWGSDVEFDWHLLPYGCYASNLLGYIQVFEKKSIMLLESQALLETRGEALRQVFAFLELPPMSARRYSREWHVGRYDTEIPTKAAAMLADFYAKENQKLAEIFGRHFSWMNGR